MPGGVARVFPPGLPGLGAARRQEGDGRAGLRVQVCSGPREPPVESARAQECILPSCEKPLDRGSDALQKVPGRAEGTPDSLCKDARPELLSWAAAAAGAGVSSTERWCWPHLPFGGGQWAPAGPAPRVPTRSPKALRQLTGRPEPQSSVPAAPGHQLPQDSWGGKPDASSEAIVLTAPPACCQDPGFRKKPVLH